MPRKPWPYWVKGMILFGILFLPSYGVLPFGPIYFSLLLVWSLLGYEQVMHIVISGYNFYAGSLDRQHYFIVDLITIGVYILIGGFLGYLYGKFKRSRVGQKRTVQISAKPHDNNRRD